MQESLHGGSDGDWPPIGDISSVAAFGQENRSALGPY